MLLPNEPLDPADVVATLWTPEELGDPRRFRRLTKVVKHLLLGDEGKSPKAVRADDRGAARFWDNDHVAVATLERGARARLQAALLALTVIVLAHDTSEIDLHGRGEPADAGTLRTGAARGYLMHGCTVIDQAEGALVGILDHWAWRRDGAVSAEDRKQRAPTAKESHKWIPGLKRARRQLKAAGFTGRAIHAADREADDYKVFAFACRPSAKCEVVIRAKHDRAILEGADHLWAELAAQPPVLGWSLRVAVERKPVRRPVQAAAAAAKAAATRTRRRAAQTEARAQHLAAQVRRRPGLAAQAATARATATHARDAALTAEIAAIAAQAAAATEVATARRQGPLLAPPATPSRRTAHVELRFAPVTIRPTNAKEGTRPLPLTAVYVREIAPPPNVVPVEWMLLTTLPVNTVAAARFVVECYEARWGCEEFHKILKSGLALEGQLVRDLTGFRRVLAVLAPIATHLARWTHAARVTPTAPAAGHVQPATLDALKEISRERDLPLPRRPWTLADVIGRLAELGGYEPRPDRVPGWIVIWRGWRILETFWATYQFTLRRRKQALS